MNASEKVSNGKRLIDANRALEIVRDQGIAHPNAYHLTNYATLILREAPTVNAVEVVRCFECKHLIFSDCYGECGKGHMGIVRPDDFCSYGEPKECVQKGGLNKMGKRGRPLKADKRDDSYRLRLNAEEREMLTQISEWTEQPIAAVIRAALRSYYETIEFKRNTYFNNLEEENAKN